MTISLVQILMPLGAASNPPSFVPVLAFDLGQDCRRVLWRQPGRAFRRRPPGGVIAVAAFNLRH